MKLMDDVKEVNIKELRRPWSETAGHNSAERDLPAARTQCDDDAYFSNY